MADNVFGMTDNRVNAPPSRIAPPSEARARTQPDTKPMQGPGDKPTKQVTGRSTERGPMSGIESAMSAQADKLHATGRLKPGEQSRG